MRRNTSQIQPDAIARRIAGTVEQSLKERGFTLRGCTVSETKFSTWRFEFLFEDSHGKLLGVRQELDSYLYITAEEGVGTEEIRDPKTNLLLETIFLPNESIESCLAGFVRNALSE